VRRCAAALALAVACGADAARIESIVVSHAAGHFTVAAIMLLDAPPAAVRAALTDFAHLRRLSPSILESRVVGETADGPLVFTVSKACAMWFCRELRKTELVTVRGDEIVAIAVPGADGEESTVTHSLTRWRLTPLGAGTRVEITSEVDPAFFVPPLLGPPLVKKTMKRETEALAHGLESAARAIARAAASAPAAPPPEPDRGG
jgi:carbon monoxide dehydrogenase subunit G